MNSSTVSMLGVQLRRLSPLEFDGSAEIYGTQLDTTDDLGTVCGIIKECSEKQSCCIQVIGDPGSGRTTFTQAVCMSLLDNRYSATQLLFVEVQPGINEASVWTLFSELAKEKQEKETVSVFSQTSVKLLKKLQTLVSFLQLHYKLICLDSVDHDGLFLFTLISSALLRAGCKVIIASSRDVMNHSFNPWEVFHSVHVSGLQEVHLSDYCTIPLLSNQLLLLRTSEILSRNPVSLKLFCNFVKEFSLSAEQAKNQLRVLEIYKLENEDQKPCHAVQLVLKLVYHWLDQNEKLALLQLSQLRQPLPLLDTESVDQLVRMSLVDVNECVYSNGKLVYFISMPTCTRRHFQEEFSKNEADGADGSLVCNKKEGFDVLQMWLSLISKELLELVENAECSMWPFVPEKWQYIPKVGPEESYNVKELITSRNAVITSLTELDIMQECLHHAIVMKRYSKLAALVFVMDRFMYWQEGSRSTMKLVDFLQSHSPQTPISPQLVIRKARVMKNDGDLQGVERTLDMLLMEKEVLGKWRYKEEHDHRLVSAVCVQIKGDIQYTLGQWMDGARLLLDSTVGFNSLPKPDKKGLSASNGLLANCLQNLSVPEYLHLAPSYSLVQGHPLLEAYKCCTEAAHLSQFTPMFFSRHKGQAGAILLEYAKQLKDENQRQMALQAAIQDLEASIQSHRTVSSLTSREEFFVFNCALFRLSLAYKDSSPHSAAPVGENLLSISKILYEHYCSFGKVVLLDGKTTELISLALNILGLEQFTVEEVSGAVLKSKESTGTQQDVFVNLLHTVHGKQEARVNPLVGTKQRDLNERKLLSSCTSSEQFSALGIVEDVECAGKVGGKPSSTSESVKPFRVAATVGQNAITKENMSRTDSDTQFKSAASFTQEAPTKEISSLELVEQLKKAVTLSQIAVTQELPLDPKSDWVVADHEAAAKETTNSGSATGWAVVDQEAVTKETASYGSKTGWAVVDQESVTKEKASSGSRTGWAVVDQVAVTKETSSSSDSSWAGVCQGATTKGNSAITVDNSIIAQGLEETAELPTELVMPGITSCSATRQLDKQLEKATRVQEAVAWKYDPIHRTWKGKTTLVFVGSPLELEKDKKGSQRDAFTVEYIDQDEPMGRYVAKQYKKPRSMQQYQQDIMCQMTARQYVGLFNQQLYQSGIQAGSIQFLPVALLQLMKNDSDANAVYNVEPFMAGEFTKLTNNLDFAWRDGICTDLVLAFGHFTYQASGRKLIIVDIQGWVPGDNSSCIFLTDPQIHSPVYKCFGTGNFGSHGFERFWSKMHPKCNAICERLGLERPCE